MVYIFTATYYEASAWIAHFHLKKDTENFRFQTFSNEDAGICLTITGVGMVPAAVAVSSICTAFVPGQGDFLINAGICAAVGAKKEVVGNLFLCNKITEFTTGKTFYPDVLYRHAFDEAELVTGAKPFEKGACEPEHFFLYDMEAAAVYQAGSYFFAPHQMIFFKIVSDNGDAGSVTPEQVKRLIDLHIDALADYVQHLLAIAQEEEEKEPVPEAAIEKLCQDMYCSVSMKASLQQHIRYCALAGIDYEDRIGKMYRENWLPCRNKREGKRCFEELKRQLL